MSHTQSSFHSASPSSTLKTTYPIRNEQYIHVPIVFEVVIYVVINLI